MDFLKYVFYKSYISKKPDKMEREGGAALVLTFCITLNIVSIISLGFAYFNYLSLLALPYNLLITFFITTVANYFLLLSKSQYKEIVDEFSQKPYNKKMEVGRWIYFIATPLIFIGSIIVLKEADGNILHKDPVFTTAVITKEYQSGRGGWKSRYFNYSFKVNGKSYGSYCVYPVEFNKIKAGDSCRVVYARSNPEINGAVYKKNSEIVEITYRKPDN